MQKINTSTLTFLKQLKANNNKDWFELNRNNYETAKSNFLEFITELIQELEKIDPTIKGIEPKKTIFRINRDIRFSKDKSPYKVNMGASMSKGSKLTTHAGYYFHLQPGNSFCGGGFYMPMPDQLHAIRQEIDYNFQSFKKILNDKKFKTYFGEMNDIEKLKTVPKGYNSENPATEYLKHKSFIVTKNYKDKELTSPIFLKELVQAFNLMHPFISFLNNAIQ